MKLIETQVNVNSEKEMTIKLPDEIPEGKHKVSIVFDLINDPKDNEEDEISIEYLESKRIGNEHLMETLDRIVNRTPYADLPYDKLKELAFEDVEKKYS
jgi:hypothetical protein